MRRAARRNAGFILVASLLTLAVIATLVTSVMLSSRARLKLAGNIRLAAEAEAIADGMVRLMILDRHRALQQGQRSFSRLPWNGDALACRGPSASIVFLTVEDEGGKVDLNAASAPLLAMLVKGLEPLSSTPDVVVANIERYRSVALEGGRTGAFVSTQELASALPADPIVARRMLPHVTVHSRRPTLDETVAKPATIMALAGSSSSQIPRLFQAPSGSTAFRFRADVVTESGTRFVRDALVELGQDAARPYAIHEWLRGAAGPRGPTTTVSLPDC
jgi:general secretion pathway protein K